MSTTNSIDDNGLLYFYQTIKGEMPSKISDLTNDSDFVEDANYVHTDNNYSGTEKDKLAGIEAGAEANVQSDWNETDNTKASFIKNKPSATTQEQADWNQSDNTKVDYIKNKPTIPDAQVQSDWTESNTSSKAYIQHKPTLGSAAAKNSTNAVTQGSTDLVESGAVKSYVDSVAGSVYRPSGDKAVAELLPALLIADNLGNVYNLSDSGVTNQYFVEGAGYDIYKGENVQIVYHNNTYMFDRMSGIVDLSGYMKTTDIHWMTNAEIEALIHPTTP